MSDLFDGMDIKYGRQHVPLTEARALVEQVALLAWKTDTYYAACQKAERDARKLGAWSVARALCWAAHPSAHDRVGYTGLHATLDAAAERWLARIERARLEELER